MTLTCKMWCMGLISVGQIHVLSWNGSGQLKSMWLGKAPEKMKLHHLSLLQVVKLLLEEFKRYSISTRWRIWRGKWFKNDWQGIVMWYNPCGKQQSSDTKQCRSYYYFQYRSVPFELNMNIIMPLVTYSVLQHFFILFWLACAISLYLPLYMSIFPRILQFSFRFSDC